MATAFAAPQPGNPDHHGSERVLAFNDETDPVEHIQTQTAGMRGTNDPPLATATDLYDQQPDAHPVEILLWDDIPNGATFWLKQYGMHLAETIGTVAFVTPRRQGTMIEFFGATREIPDPPAADMSNIAQFTTWLQSHVARTIVMPTARIADEILTWWQIPIRLMSGTSTQMIQCAFKRSRCLVEHARATQRPLPNIQLLLLNRNAPNEQWASTCASRFAYASKKLFDLEITLDSILSDEEQPVEAFTAPLLLPPIPSTREPSCPDIEILDALSVPMGPFPFPARAGSTQPPPAT